MLAPPRSRIFTSLSSLKSELDEKGRFAEQLKQTIQQSMGDASKALFAHGEVTYKRSRDGTSVDTKRLAADHPALAAQYTVPRPGSRRFVLSLSPDATEGVSPC